MWLPVWQMHAILSVSCLKDSINPSGMITIRFQPTQKIEGRSDANFVVTGSTRGCHNNIARCHQWWHSWHHDSFLFWVQTTVLLTYLADVSNERRRACTGPRQVSVGTGPAVETLAVWRQRGRCGWRGRCRRGTWKRNGINSNRILVHARYNHHSCITHDDSSVKIRTICHAQDLWKLAWSCKQLHLLCLPDQWNLAGTALLSGF